MKRLNIIRKWNITFFLYHLKSFGRFFFTIYSISMLPKESKMKVCLRTFICLHENSFPLYWDVRNFEHFQKTKRALQLPNFHLCFLVNVV